MQIRALAALLRLDQKYKTSVLILAGSVRNAGDEERVESLKALAKELEVQVCHLIVEMITRY